MKKHQLLIKGLILVLFVSSFSGCLKDSGTQTYKLYRPVLQKLSDVRSAVKIAAPTPIVVPGKIYVYGNSIFLVENGKGIHIIDNTNPVTPINKYFISIPGNYDIAVKGNTLYADCFTDLLAIDISNPANSSVQSFIPNLFPNRRNVKGYLIDSGYMPIAWIEKDTTIQIGLMEGQGIWRNGGFISPIFMDMMSLSNNSSAAKATNGTGGSMSSFAIVNQWLYTLSVNQLASIHIIEPTKMVVNNKQPLTFVAETIYPFQDKLFVGSQTGMNIYSISSPSSPNYLSGFSHARLCDPVIADNQYAYVTLRSTENVCGGNRNELDVIDVSNINNPTLVKVVSLVHPHGLSRDGNTLIICDGDAGLKIFDVSNPKNPVLIQTIEMAATYDVIAENNIAIVSAKDGLYQFDYSKPSQTKLISKTSLSN